MARLKLNQVVALVTGRKTKAQQTLTQTHRWVPESINGLSRTYTPINAEGERLPEETKMVQVKVDDAIKKIVSEMDDYFNLVATQERGNQTAKADIRVGTTLVAKDVPVTVLLFLEKQVVDLRTFISNLPTLPVDREWKFDGNKNCFVTDPTAQIRTKKMKKVLIKYEATKEHPAQTETYDSDETVGHYSTTYMSGAIKASDKAAMMDRVERLSDAIKTAREEANSIEVEEMKIGKDVLNFIFDVKMK